VAPKVDTSVWQGLLAPAGTPAPILQKIRDDTAAALAMRDVQDKLVGMGMEIVPGTPEAFAQFLRDDIETWRRVAKAAAIQPE
jgi:tripartite-type tricarboxylate transporter receptor subunit TctC